LLIDKVSGTPSKKNSTGDLQYLRNLLQSARAEPVRALLVFLYLLKREAELLAQLLLADAQHHPPHTHPAADVLVERVRGLFGWHQPSPLWRAARIPGDARTRDSPGVCGAGAVVASEVQRIGLDRLEATPPAADA
jgi:hypothetical protein